MPQQSSFGERLKMSLAFWVLWLISTLLAASCRFKVIGQENLEKLAADGKGGLVVLWHGVTILPIYYCRNRGFYSLVSVSRDGELQNRLLKSRGYRTIRGSSARQGARAVLESARALKAGGIMALTPDGPKGPSKQVQPGTSKLAMMSGVPILPVGVACKPCKRLHSWDKHMIPLPFSRVVLVFGQPFVLPPTEDEAGAAKRIGDAINLQESLAEEALG